MEFSGAVPRVLADSSRFSTNISQGALELGFGRAITVLGGQQMS
jgi:hypothetical protein